jgi:hypothetical protein
MRRSEGRAGEGKTKMERGTSDVGPTAIVYGINKQGEVETIGVSHHGGNIYLTQYTKQGMSYPHFVHSSKKRDPVREARRVFELTDIFEVPVSSTDDESTKRNVEALKEKARLRRAELDKLAELGTRH